MLEDSTGYNRKEKSLHIKHKDLIKSLAKGMPILGFNSFSMNMPFYFGAFAYPSDMRKIIEESKQQYRTQNEVLTKALFVVELVDNCFNRFSKKILNDLLAVPQFSFLIHYYLENGEDFTNYPKPFQNCEKTLRKAGEVVGSFSSSMHEKLCKSNVFLLRDEFFLFETSDSL